MATHEAYERRPDEIDAVQWDGTIEGGKKVADLLMKHERSADVSVVHRFTGVNALEPILDFAMRHDRSQSHRLHKGDWIFVSRDEGMKYLPDNNFRALYRRK